MAESFLHKQLVKGIDEWFRQRVGKNINHYICEIDLSEHLTVGNNIRNIGGKRPDAYYAREQEEEYIGEAKTAADITVERTKGQLKAFLGYLKKSQYKKRFLILSVAWHDRHKAHHRVCDLNDEWYKDKPLKNIEIIILPWPRGGKRPISFTI